MTTEYCVKPSPAYRPGLVLPELPCPPDGDGWQLVATAVEQLPGGLHRVLYTWQRPLKGKPWVCGACGAMARAQTDDGWECVGCGSPATH